MLCTHTVFEDLCCREHEGQQLPVMKFREVEACLVTNLYLYLYLITSVKWVHCLWKSQPGIPRDQANKRQHCTHFYSLNHECYMVPIIQRNILTKPL